MIFALFENSFGPFCLWWHWLVIFALFENSFGHVWAGKPLPSAAHSTTSMNCRLIKAVLIHHLTIMCLASNTHATLTTYHWQESLCNYITATEGGWSYGQLLITRGCCDDRRPAVCHHISELCNPFSVVLPRLDTKRVPMMWRHHCIVVWLKKSISFHFCIF